MVSTQSVLQKEINPPQNIWKGLAQGAAAILDYVCFLILINNQGFVGNHRKRKQVMKLENASLNQF